MTRNRKMVVLTATLLVVAVVVSSCELSLNNVDCSGIDQPDMGGLVCLGANVVALQAGAALIVMEMVPATLAAEVTASLSSMATIGIGAGVDCHGQVLVLHDLIGVFPGKRPRFARNFMEGATSIDDAVTRYVSDVREGRFPGPEHSY